VETPSDSRAVATGTAAPTASTPADYDAEIKALEGAKPKFLYYYVAATEPTDENYKFSRGFELGVLQDKVVETLNKKYLCNKIELPIEADMKVAKNQARIEVWSATGERLSTIARDNSSILAKAAFLAFVQKHAARNEALVKKEVARLTKLKADFEKKQAEAKKGEETAKAE
jgi:hypothetical protein